MKKVVIVLQMLWYIGSPALRGNEEVSKLRNISEHHIVQEQQRLKNRFTRTAWARHGLTLSAITAAGLMLYWWSKGDVRYTFKDDQQDLLRYFNHLPDDKKYEFLIGKTHEVESLSWSSLVRKIIPYALGTAASNIVFNSLQLIITQPLSKMISALYFPQELGWFLQSQTNITQLFEALQVSAVQLDHEQSAYQKMMFIDLMNSLTFQVERIIAFMNYQLTMVESAGNKRMFSTGVKALEHLRATCTVCIDGMNKELKGSESLALLAQLLTTFKNEFDSIIKQLQAIEKICT